MEQNEKDIQLVFTPLSANALDRWPLPYVRVKKVAAVGSPLYPTATPEQYTPGAENPGVSPPIEYEVEGHLLFPIEVGQSIFLDRRKRNGEEVRGTFRSSQVQSIDGNKVNTFNSVYLVELA